MALADFDVTLSPAEPGVTFKATALSDTALSVTVQTVTLNSVTMTPKSDGAKIAAGIANDLAKLAPGVLKKKVEGRKVDVPLNATLGTDIVIGGQNVSVKLTSPELGSHGGMFMVSGTFTVS